MASALAWIMGIKQMKQNRAMAELQTKMLDAQLEEKQRQQDWYKKQPPEVQQMVREKAAGVYQSPKEKMLGLIAKQFDPEAQRQTAGNMILNDPRFDEFSSVQPERGPDSSMPGGGFADPVAEAEKGLAEQIAQQNLSRMMGVGMPSSAGAQGGNAAVAGDGSLPISPMRQMLMKELLGLSPDIKIVDEKNRKQGYDTLGRKVGPAYPIPVELTKATVELEPGVKQNKWVDPFTGKGRVGDISDRTPPTMQKVVTPRGTELVPVDQFTGQPVGTPAARTSGVGTSTPTPSISGPGSPGTPQERLLVDLPKALSGEAGAKVAMLSDALTELPFIQSVLYNPDGSINYWAIWQTGPGPLPEIPRTKGRSMLSSFKRLFEAKIRIESGAAIPPEELDRLYERYMPSWQDTKGDIDRKMASLERFAFATVELVTPQQAKSLLPEETYFFEKDGKKRMYKINLPPNNVNLPEYYGESKISAQSDEEAIKNARRVFGVTNGKD